MTSIETLQLNTVHEAAASEVDAIRRPEQIYTDGYLESPINFHTDQRFIPSSVTTQLSMLPDALKRDFVSAIQININTEDRQGVPISMYSPVWSRKKYTDVIGTRSGFIFF